MEGAKALIVDRRSCLAQFNLHIFLKRFKIPFRLVTVTDPRLIGNNKYIKPDVIELDCGSGAAYSNGLIGAFVATGASGTLMTYSSAVSIEPIPNPNVILVPRPKRFRALSLLSDMQSDAYERGEKLRGAIDFML
jgi:hypothetical protein